MSLYLWGWCYKSCSYIFIYDFVYNLPLTIIDRHGSFLSNLQLDIMAMVFHWNILGTNSLHKQSKMNHKCRLCPDNPTFPPKNLLFKKRHAV